MVNGGRLRSAIQLTIERLYQVFYGFMVCPWYAYSQTMISEVSPQPQMRVATTRLIIQSHSTYSLRYSQSYVTVSSIYQMRGVRPMPGMGRLRP